MRVVEADRPIHQEHRDRHHHRRQHSCRQDEEEKVRLAGDLEAREAVSGEGSHADGQHGADDRHDQAVHETVGIL